MKQVIASIVKKIKTLKRGNSLAEFAVTTAVMATLAATAAPRLSELSEGAKAEKTFEHMDKIIKQAGNFYQRTADWEGRGRFPGQEKFNHSVGGEGHSYWNDNASTEGLAEARQRSADHHEAVLKDLGLYDGADGWRDFDDHQKEVEWYSVFGEAGGIEGMHTANLSTINQQEEWLSLFGYEALFSPYQDGHYAYTVVAGGGSGDDVFPPVIYVVDIENAVHYNNVLTP